MRISMKKRNKILLIGDFSINRFYHGKINAIARDAPIPIVNITETETFLGSSGIIIKMLSKMGVKPIPISIIGNDLASEWMLNELVTLRIPVNRIIKNNLTKTSITSRLIVDSTQIARFDEISQAHIEKIAINKLFNIIEGEIKGASLVVICDYGLGLFTESVVNKIIAETKRNGVDLFISSTGTNYLNYKGSNSMIKINTENSLLLIKERESDKISSHEILSRLEEVLMTDKILLTRSHDGIAVYEHGIVTEMPATQDRVIDIKGIGEVMIAAITYSLLSKNNFLEACKLGNIAAGIAASKGDINIISKADIMKAKRNYDEWLDQK